MNAVQVGVKDWRLLLERALAGPSACHRRSLDRAPLRASMEAVDPTLFFPADESGTTDPDELLDGPYGADLAGTLEIVARMIDALDLSAEDRVLEIGTRCGYSAAVLGGLAREVVTLERDPAMAERAIRHLTACGRDNVRIVNCDGTTGFPEEGPWNAILVSSGSTRIAKDVRQQLAPGGRMVYASGLHRLRQSLRRVTRTAGGAFVEERLGPVEQRRPLGDLLVDMRVVGRRAVEEAARAATETGRRIGEILQERANVEAADVFRALARQRAVRFDTARNLLPHLDPEVFSRVPRAFLQHQRVLPVGAINDRIVVACTDADTPTADLSKAFHPTPVVLCLVTPTDLQRLWTAADLASDRPEGAVATETTDEFDEEIPEEEDFEDLAGTQDAALRARYVALFESVVIAAVGERASDIHFERIGRRVRVRIRVDGELRELKQVRFSARDLIGVINVIKIKAELDIAERRRPQGGRIRFRAGVKPLDLRIQTQPSLDGENAVLRLLPRDVRLPSIEELGFPDPVARAYERLLEEPSGLVLVVGPTGSGKTTTLYAGLRILADDVRRKVITAEDPIEVTLRGIQQTQVRKELDYTFDAAIRSFLRQDPDVILVGEIRDHDTALEAIRASQTGHVVLSTLHCNDATDAVQRLYDLGIHPNSIASELASVFAQRLARRVCDRCREPAEPEAELIAELFPDGAPATFRCFRGAGCDRCSGRGTYGRVAIVEHLPVGPEFRDVIATHPPLGEMRRAAYRHGLRPMRGAFLEHVLEGTIALAEARRVMQHDRMAPGR